MSESAESARATPTERYRIEHNGNRNWALFCEGEILAVTVYQKGAQAVRGLLEAKDAHIAVQQARIEELTAVRCSPSFQERIRPGAHKQSGAFTGARGSGGRGCA